MGPELLHSESRLMYPRPTANVNIPLFFAVCDAILIDEVESWPVGDRYKFQRQYSGISPERVSLV